MQAYLSLERECMHLHCLHRSSYQRSTDHIAKISSSRLEPPRSEILGTGCHGSHSSHGSLAPFAQLNFNLRSLVSKQNTKCTSHENTTFGHLLQHLHMILEFRTYRAAAHSIACSTAQIREAYPTMVCQPPESRRARASLKNV